MRMTFGNYANQWMSFLHLWHDILIFSFIH